MTTAMTSWELFEDLRAAQDELLQASLGRGWRPTGRQHYSDAGTAVWTPAVDISERKDAYLVTVELPGVKADDVELTFEDVRKVLSVMQKSGAKTVKLGVQEKQ